MQRCENIKVLEMNWDMICEENEEKSDLMSLL